MVTPPIAVAVSVVVAWTAVAVAVAVARRYAKVNTQSTWSRQRIAHHHPGTRRPAAAPRIARGAARHPGLGPGPDTRRTTACESAEEILADARSGHRRGTGR